MSETEIEEAKKIRAILKSKLTRNLNLVNTVDRENLTVDIVKELEVRNERLEPLLNEFEEVQVKIEIAENIEFDDFERKTFEDKYFSILAKIKTLLEIFYNIDNKSVSGDNSEASRSNQNNRTKIKLPDIKLPVFGGEYSEWSAFKELFQAVIDKDDDLPAIQKFYYLKGCLSDSVKKVINKLEVSAGNYPVAWKILTERYENKTLLIHNHIQAIFDISPLNSKVSHLELRSLYDTTIEHLSALKALGENTDSWDRLIIFILCKKFDNATLNAWEAHQIKGDLPTLEDLDEFLKFRCTTLEKINKFKNVNEKGIFENKKIQDNKKYQSYVTTSEEKKVKCYLCKKEHTIFKCEKFVNLSPEQKTEQVKRLKLCLNCLRPSHPSWKCKLSKCFKCNKAHNTILHITYDKSSEREPTIGATNTESSADSNNGKGERKLSLVERGVSAAVLNSEIVEPCQVLLATALIKVKTNNNKWIICRALLDSASQSNFISECVTKRLKIPQDKLKHEIRGIGNTLTNISNQVNIEIKSLHSNFNSKIKCLILNQVTDKLPSFSFSKNMLNIPGDLKLADPNFNISSDTDILLGSSIFWTVICNDQRQLGPNAPVLQSTLLGWILAGKLFFPQNSTRSLSCLSLNKNEINLENALMKFWSLEEVLNINHLSEAERYCEKHFEENTVRDKSGRFIVSLPFKDDLKNLGDSYEMAYNRFLSLEKRLSKNIELKKDYCEFIREFEELNHMNRVSCLRESTTKGTIHNEQNKKLNLKDGYFLPHHAVVKESLTTKCRVVFDASAKTSSGLSLNDVQYVGPTLQQDVFSILNRFRTHKYVMCADISKMYRQILVHKDHRKYQRILWRAECTDELKVFEINRVVYGNASSPYLAVKCLFQLARENEIDYPSASNIIKRDFYMDDLLTGANTEMELLKLQIEISQILTSAGFELRKWLCNDKEILNKFEVNNKLKLNVLQIGENEQNKTLGVFWDANKDVIKYKTNNNASLYKLSKRIILSITCQIFDPLGLLGAYLLLPKLIMQDLWKLKLGWDQEVPLDIAKKWSEFAQEFSDIPSIEICRQVVDPCYCKIELHGFSDASERAYGACVFVRCLTPLGKKTSNLLCAKSRISPIKKISIPRLELCGALLLANLVNKVITALNITFDETFLWTDSMITLAWIKGDPSRWKTFIANRVGEIQTLTEINNWYHVKSEHNPADLISRGVSLNTLKESNLWWHGPSWFEEENSNWKFNNVVDLEDIPEQKIISCVSIKPEEFFGNLINKYSDLQKLQCVVARVLRFTNNIKVKKNERHYGPLNVMELRNAIEVLIRSVQKEHFPNEYINLQNNKAINLKSKILSLNPFIENGLLRVGGRIRHSNESYDKKFPIILPKNNKLTYLILQNEHKRLLHGGVQSLLCSIRNKYWIISGRNTCKKIVNDCIVCFRAKPRSFTYLMGDLPEVRVNNYSPFFNVGVDYGGPYLIKDRKGRGSKLSKAYVCLFVCLSTKAVHIELVSELTTEAFLASFNRFASRRGKPKNVFSDNGSNFIGAHNELSQISKFLKVNQEFVINKLAIDQIKWNFIPARSPNFGGIWEAGIKSTKYHIKRLLKTPLTYEDFYTLLVRIEGILNSRPLCPLTEDPDDVSALTPAHFLIGKQITTFPEVDLRDVSDGKLSHWQHIQKLTQHYWTRWSKEYLSELQTRVKWKTSSQSIKDGALVLIKNEDSPTMLWRLGRVVKCCPGKDGVVRVVNIKTQNGTLTRSVNNICVLPVE